MSWKISGACWDLDLPANKMLVLLALADHADHEGNNVYPSIGLVAWKTGYSENQVRRIMHALVKDGILIEINRTPGKVVKYSIDTNRGKAKTSYVPKDKKHSQNDTPPKMVAHPSQNGSPTPTIAMIAEPSLKSINETKDSATPNGAADAPNPKLLYDVIQDIWHYTAGLNQDFAKMLLGIASKKGYKEYNLQPGINEDDLRRWAGWWRAQFPDLSMLEKRDKIQSSIGYWRSIGEPDVVTTGGGLYRPYNEDSSQG